MIIKGGGLITLRQTLNPKPYPLPPHTPHFGNFFERPSEKIHLRKTHPKNKAVIVLEKTHFYPPGPRGWEEGGGDYYPM